MPSSMQGPLYNAARGAQQPGTHPLPPTPVGVMFDAAGTEAMREWDLWTQGPLGVKGDPADRDTSQQDWNAYFGSRFGMSWFWGLYPSQSGTADAIPSPVIMDSAFTYHKMWQSVYMNQSQYLRHGASAPIGVGALQVQQFKEATDHSKPQMGAGPGSAFSGPNFSPYFGAVDY